MWQNIIILLIIVACLFFIGRHFRQQLTGNKDGCAGKCCGCDTPATKRKDCETKKPSRLP